VKKKDGFNCSSVDTPRSPETLLSVLLSLPSSQAAVSQGLQAAMTEGRQEARMVAGEGGRRKGKVEGKEKAGEGKECLPSPLHGGQALPWNQ
jgi:flagellar biosynthesis/type III secretory pathway protein FliH